MRAAAASSRGSQPPNCNATRMLPRIMLEQPLRVAAHDGRRHDHLGVQQGVRREQPMHVAAVAVGPLHHRRNR